MAPPPDGTSNEASNGVLIAAGFELRGPSADSPLVEAWSQQYVPFEPRTANASLLRDELRARVGRLQAGPDRVLHAVFAGPKPANSDVENALLYNIDVTGGCFQQAAHRGVAFEHSPGAPEPAPSGTEYACKFRYQLVRPRQPFVAWDESRELANWEALPVGSLAGEKKLEVVWWALSRAEIAVAAPVRAADAPFAISLELRAPKRASAMTVALVKGLFDGVVASFQSHLDRATAPDLARRLANTIAASPAEIEAQLLSDRQAVLGAADRLLHARGKGVQWSPADHLLAAGSLLLLPPRDNEWTLGGRVSEVIVRADA